MQTEDFQAIVRRYAVRRQAAVDEKSQEELANLFTKDCVLKITGKLYGYWTYEGHAGVIKMAKDFPPPSNDNIRLDTCAGNLQVEESKSTVRIVKWEVCGLWGNVWQPLTSRFTIDPNTRLICEMVVDKL